MQVLWVVVSGVTPPWENGDMAKPYEIVNNGMSLAEFFRLYPSDIEAEDQFVAWRWPDGTECPHCGSDRISDVKSRRPQPWRCKDCRRHFSHTTDTPMHDSKLGARTWLLGLFLIVSNPKGRSSVQLAADLGITQKSAWHVGHRIREGLASGSLPGFEGPRRGRRDLRRRQGQEHARLQAPRAHPRTRRGGQDPGGGSEGPRQRQGGGPADGRHRQRHPDRDRLRDDPAGSTVFTDGDRGYDSLKDMGYLHAKVLHSVGEYVRGPRLHERDRELLVRLEAQLHRHVPLVVGRPPPPIRRGARLPLQQPQSPCRPPHGHGRRGDGGPEAPVARTCGRLSNPTCGKMDVRARRARRP